MIPGSTHGTGNFRLLKDASLPLSLAILILLGSLLTMLGILLFPVNLGILPFSPDGQMGLILVITAIQMMALGETPVGQYTRSWLVIILGTVFAAMGIVSCIVPGILTFVIQILLGVLNITGGVLLLVKRVLTIYHDRIIPQTEPAPAILKKLLITQSILNIVSIGFGVSMLLPGLVPGMIVAGILVINGLLLFALASIIQKISSIPGG